MKLWPYLFLISLMAATINPSQALIKQRASLHYSIKDLQVLEEERSYEEFFLHARDIRPSQRTQLWRDMVNHMAESYTQHILAQKIFTRKILEQIEELFDWPLLPENSLFTRDRGQIGLAYFKNCFTSPEEKKVEKKEEKIETCLKEMNSFWQRNPQDPYLGLELARLLISARPNSPHEAWSYLQRAINHDFSTFLCKDPLIKESVFLHFSDLLTSAEEKSEKIKKFVNESLSTDCWKVIRQDLNTALLGGSRGQIQKNAYLLLKMRSDVNELQKDFYLTLYLLQGPVAGEDLFNESWNNLKVIGGHYTRRTQVLELMKKIDPLPGKVFALHDPSKKKIILDYFYKHFPEYMDYYARTCLDYLSGRKAFPQGNPTLFCKDLFQASKNTLWIDPDLHKSYSRILKY